MKRNKIIGNILLLVGCLLSSGIGAQPAALIPLPQEISWKKGQVPLSRIKRIVINDTALGKEALQLQEYFRQMGYSLPIVADAKSLSNALHLQKASFSFPQNEAEGYRLEVDNSTIQILANTAHGIFNGIQTLRQLIRENSFVPELRIKDWPAFSWRGYMIDVGRNFMSVSLLKQQIDIMALYKLNVFHFHATENIAWRFASKIYPQLNAPEHMIRNKGRYYSEADIQELITYCRERHILFVPEIDMPGHSAAFERAMKTNMQSDSGLAIIKNILEEFCATYPVEYIHIGADEVKITNPRFLPEVSDFLRSKEKKLVGWQPGGNFTEPIIRQLWMDDNGKITSNSSMRYLDSRHLYLNHMDPLESVVTIYNRKIGNRNFGDTNALGAIICVWHDRKVSDETDILRMNPVYPGMLAFSERSWRGGGQEGWIANISDGDSKGFAAFEKRLVIQQQRFFKGLPFPYTAQAGMQWNLYGPYDNGGDLFKKFEPEEKDFDPEKRPAAIRATGGTIVLRHWWSPQVKGILPQPKENSTWYASTRIWSEKDTVRNCWIGFNNLSRSPATDSPPVGAWDEKGSNIWVNGNLVPAPVWKRGGQKGDAEIPLTDEGYEFREPSRIAFKKGWNSILVKCPIASFKARAWQNPVKWMFTFALTGP